MQDLGRAFYWQKPLFHCVNKAVVDIWSKHTAKCPPIANLLCELFFTAAKHNFTVNASHIPGTSNVLADALFHSQGRRFFQLAPGANPLPTRIPPAVWSTYKGSLNCYTTSVNIREFKKDIPTRCHQPKHLVPQLQEWGSNDNSSSEHS